MQEITTKDAIAELSCSLLSVAIPFFSGIKEVWENGKQLSDAILFDKIYKVIENHDDIESWLKIKENYDEDNKNYQKAVKQIIYTISAINEVDMLVAYSNLLRSYRLNFIHKNDFLRLGFVLTSLLSEDAHYLSANIGAEAIPENIYTVSLASNSLMYTNTGFASTREESYVNYYRFTPLGRMIDKYAFNLWNSKYSYDCVDDLSSKYLEYESKYPDCNWKSPTPIG